MALVASMLVWIWLVQTAAGDKTLESWFIAPLVDTCATFDTAEVSGCFMYVCMYVRTYVRMYVCMYDVCMYVCMYFS